MKNGKITILQIMDFQATIIVKEDLIENDSEFVEAFLDKVKKVLSLQMKIEKN